MLLQLVALQRLEEHLKKVFGTSRGKKLLDKARWSTSLGDRERVHVLRGLAKRLTEEVV